MPSLSCKYLLSGPLPRIGCLYRQASLQTIRIPALRRFWKALLAVWIGGGIGQVNAFLLARYLIQDFITALLRGKSRKWDIVRNLCLCFLSVELRQPLVGNRRC